MPLLLSLGADVPVCYQCHSAHVTGIGEKMTPVDVPEMAAVLVNPRQSCATPEIFSLYKEQARPFSAPLTSPALWDAGEMLAFLSAQRNDLQDAAIGKLPVIADVIAALSGTKTVQLVRMSGSGATVFALYPDLEAAEDAATDLQQQHPQWWVRPCTLARVVRY
jgi:4-diphosphocytidyl-2-C-methyl-D-erythritol kinase